jgi:hypothetical protein
MRPNKLMTAVHQDWIATRGPDRGQTAPNKLGAAFVSLDVTDDASLLTGSLLEQAVASPGVRRLEIAGLMTTGCVLNTALDALERALQKRDHAQRPAPAARRCACRHPPARLGHPGRTLTAFAIGQPVCLTSSAT